MNEIAQKRINDYREKIAGVIANTLGKEISEATRAKLVLSLANTGLAQYEGTVYSYLQNHLDYEEAIIAGCKYQSEKFEEFLYQKLFDPKAAHRDVIAEQLGMRKNPGSVKHFSRLLADEDRQVRFQAIHALFNIGGKDAALALCEYISDPDEWISMNILRLLCIMREHETIPILAEKFHQDDDLRRKALMVSFLARFKSVTLIRIFDEGIEAKDARLKANSIEALGGLELPDKEIRERVEPFLHDPNNRIRANTILVLAKAHPDLVQPEIKEMVESNDVQLRRSAAFILGMISPHGYEDLAAKLVVDQNEAVRKRMVQSLRNFPAQFVCDQLEQALDDENKWMRKFALDMAAKIPEFPVDKVLALLRTERAAPNLEACMNFFAAHPVEAALTPLKLHVKDRRHQVVKALLNAVVAISSIEGVKSIAPRLDQRDPKVIRILTEVLVKAGERKILDDLIEKFSASKKEGQILNLMPPLDSCLSILNMGENMPEPLIESLEQIVVEEKSAPVPESGPDIEGFKQPTPGKVAEKTSFDNEFEDALASLDAEDSIQQSNVQADAQDGVEIRDSEDMTLSGSEDSASMPVSDQQITKAPVETFLGEDLALPSLDMEQPAEKPRKKKKSPHYVKGLKAYNLGKFKRAIKEFNVLIESEDKVPGKVYLYMGIMHAEAGKFEHARAFFETFLKDEPAHPKGNYLYGKALKELKDWAGLIKTYNRFTTGEVEASPKLKKQIYRELGIANVLVGKYDRGFQLLNTLLKVEPDNPEVAYYTALALFHLHKPGAAAAMLDNVMKHAGKDTRIAKLAQALSTKLRSG